MYKRQELHILLVSGGGGDGEHGLAHAGDGKHGTLAGLMLEGLFAVRRDHTEGFDVRRVNADVRDDADDRNQRLFQFRQCLLYTSVGADLGAGAAVGTFAFVDVGHVLLIEGDGAKAAHVLAAMRQAAAAGVGNLVAAQGALVTGCLLYTSRCV